MTMMVKNSYWKEKYQHQLNTTDSYFLKHMMFTGNTISTVVKPRNIFYFETNEKIDGKVIDKTN